MKNYIFVWIFFLSIFIHAQTTNCALLFSGNISDIHDNSALNQAKVTLSQNGKMIQSAETDSLGNFHLSNLCSGSYTVEISHEDCSTKMFKISIQNNIKRNFSLEHHTRELQEVVTIGKSSVKTKSSTEIKLNKQEIDDLSETNLGTALKNISGVSAYSSGNNIVKPVIHGLHSSRVPVLNNGVRQEDQEWGVEHAPNIDLNVANSLSVIKGAGALQYAGDAVGGMVLVEPKALIRKDTLTGQILSSYISNGRGGNVSSQIEKGFANGWAFRIQGTYKKLGDMKAPDYNLSNTGVKENDFSFQTGYENNKWGINAYYSFFGTEIGILRAAHIGNLENLVDAINSQQPLYIYNFTEKINSPKQEIQHHLAKVSAFTHFSFGKLMETYSYQFNNRKEFDIRRTNFADIPSIDLDLSTHNLSLDFEHNNFYRFKGKIGIVGEYQQNYPNPATGVSPLIPQYQKYNVGAYWIENYAVSKKLELEGGIRYDYNKIDAYKFYKKARWDALGYNILHPDWVIRDEGLSYLTHPVLDFDAFSATLGMNYTLSPRTYWTLNYSLSNRSPNPAELFSDGLHHSAAAIELGDVDLKNETANKIITTVKTSMLDYRLNAEVTLHYNYIRNFINQIPTGAEFTIRGAFPVWQFLKTNAEIMGIDVNADYKFIRNWKIKTNFSYLYGTDKSNDVPLINMPPLQWINTLEYQNKKWLGFYARLTSTSVARQNRYPNYNFKVTVVENNTEVQKTVDLSTPPAAYQLFDFESGFSFPVTNRNNLDISLAVRNLANTSYREYLNRLRYYADEPGTNIIFKVKYNF